MEMVFSWYQIFGLLVIYSFFGWCTEVAFQAVCHGKIVNRGFLNGPVCPIYGFGVVFVLLLVEPYSSNPVLLFLGGMILTTAIELVTGWILDVAFHMRWWDYSAEPFNFRGYICLRFAFIWGLAVVGVVKIIQPPIFAFINLIPHVLGVVLLVVIGVVFVADFAVTLRSVIGLRKSLGELEKIAAKLHAMSDDLTEIVSSSALKADGSLKEMKEKADEQKAKTKAAIEAKQQAFDEKVSENIKQFNDKLSAVKAEIAEAKPLNEKIDESLTALAEKYKKQQSEDKTKELEEQYDRVCGNINKSFGRRRILKAYPQLHRSSQNMSLTDEIANLKLKIANAKEQNRKSAEKIKAILEKNKKSKK